MSTLHSTGRRVPPPCWTQDETIALIHAYRDKWYSVNRGNLRAADWDGVSSAVAEASSSQLPKSSLQCRHKIEKLRKRYRAEKRRSLSVPGRSSSSWDLFPLLDAMSIGSSASKQCLDNDEIDEIGEGFHLKSKFSNVDQDFDPNPVFDVGLDPNLAFRARKLSRVDDDSDNTARGLGNGFYPKPDMNSVSVAFRPKDYKRIDGKLKPEIDFQCGYEAAGFSVKSRLPQVAQFKGYDNIVDNSSLPNHNAVDDYGDYIGFPLRTLGDVPLSYKGKCRKIDTKSNPDFVDDVRSRSDKRYKLGDSVADCLGLPPPVSRLNNYCKVDSGVFGNVMENGVKKLKDPIKELVSAITMSTDTFVKVEKMKMEMAMEIEKMRMDNLLKHNQMILESQQQIVDAFVKGASEHNRKKSKEYEVVSRNGDSEFATTNCAHSYQKQCH